MKTFKQFLEAIPIKKKHDKSPEAKAKRKKDKKLRLKNKGKIKQQQKKQAIIRKSSAYKNKKKQMDKQGKTMSGKKTMKLKVD